MLTNKHRKLIEENVRLVTVIIGQLRRICPQVSLIDATSIGNAALTEAAIGFRADAGFKFTSYAKVAIRNAIFNTLKEKAIYDSRFLLTPEPWGSSNLDDDGIPAVDESDHLQFSLNQLRRAMRVLPTKERLLVKAYFGIGRERQAMEAIAAQCGQGRRTVKKRLTQAIDQLRATIAGDSL